MNTCKNNVRVVGTISSELKLEHKMKYDEMYSFMIQIPRKSGYIDEIPVWITKKNLEGYDISVGKKFGIVGEYRSYNNKETGRLILVVFAKAMYSATDENSKYSEFKNNIEINGYLAKVFEPRETPFGKRILDVLVAVNRNGNKSSYIPCVIWYPNKNIIDSFKVGQKVQVTGRIQSREYEKKYEDGNSEVRIAYEVSVIRASAIEDSDDD